jgi:hypothetical protein
LPIRKEIVQRVEIYNWLSRVRHSMMQKTHPKWMSFHFVMKFNRKYGRQWQRWTGYGFSCLKIGTTEWGHHFMSNKKSNQNEKDRENGEAIKVSVWTKLVGIAVIEGYRWIDTCGS